MFIRHFFYKVKRAPREICDGFHNIKKYWKIIWKDRDWDYCFLEQLIIFKLKNMEKFFDSDCAVSVGSEEMAKEMREVRILLEKLCEDNYIEEAQEEFGHGVETYRIADDRLDADRAKAYSLIAQNIRKWWD